MPKLIKRKVKLSNPISYFISYTHCDTLQFVANEDIDDYNEITCAKCATPTIICGSNGHWYYVGGKVF